MADRISVHESEVRKNEYADRWSKDLIGGADVKTASGFSVGIAEYHVAEFGEPQVHDDQEALYVVSGTGQVRVGDRRIDVRPGSAVYVPPKTPHATRRTGRDPVRVLYAHGSM